MTPNPPLPGRADSPSGALRGLASRAYRVLRQGHGEDRDEVRDLLDEIDRARRLFHRIASDDLVLWFDRLEAEVVERIDPDLMAEPSACGGGVGVA